MLLNIYVFRVALNTAAVLSGKDRLWVLTILIFSRLPGASVAQLVEQLICNQSVGGSSPSAGSNDIGLDVHGGVPERSKGTDCKSVGDAFGGSNPPPSTRPHSKLCVGDSQVFTTASCGLHALSASSLLCFHGRAVTPPKGICSEPNQRPHHLMHCV